MLKFNLLLINKNIKLLYLIKVFIIITLFVAIISFIFLMLTKNIFSKIFFKKKLILKK